MVDSVLGIVDEFERERARLRTFDAMHRKARAGYVAGGRVFGYSNVRVNGHVELEINGTEAAVILRMYELDAHRGLGFRRIAHLLNAEQTPSPRSQQGRPRG